MKAANAPTFSFVIPAYDRVQELYEAVNSCLSQTVAPLEIIIVLDGSPFETSALARELSLKHPQNVRVYDYSFPSGNACRARNRGILEAKGEYVSFLDSDDISPPNRIKISQEIASNTSCDVVFGSVRFWNESTRKISGISFGDIGMAAPFSFEELLIHNRIYMLTSSIKRLTLLQCGGFRPKMRYREDYELWLRLMNNGCKFECSSQILGIYRIHSGNNELAFKKDDKYWEHLSKNSYKLPFEPHEWGINS